MSDLSLVFIIGTGRCGSTLLHNIIARHKDTSFVSNIEEQYRRGRHLTPFANWMCRHDNLPLVSRYAHRFEPTEAYGLMNRQVSSIYSRPTRDLTREDVTPWLRKRFTDFFQHRHEKLGQPTFLHKYTGWSRVGFFGEIFPESRFIHVMRDGRAVANSWLQMPWWEGYQGPQHWQWGELKGEDLEMWERSGRSFVTLAGLCWLKLIRGFRRVTETTEPDRLLNLRYEDFIEDPTGKLRELLEFSDLEWDADFERQFARFNVTSSRANAFERDLTSAQQKELESVICGELEAHGYL